MKTRDTVTAAATVLLPAWLASTMHVPTATRVSVLPLTVQVLGVVDAKLTTRLELAVATNANGAVPSVWLPGPAKLMVCACVTGAATAKLRVTVAAAS